MGRAGRCCAPSPPADGRARRRCHAHPDRPPRRSSVPACHRRCAARSESRPSAAGASPETSSATSGDRAGSHRQSDTAPAAGAADLLVELLPSKHAVVVGDEEEAAPLIFSSGKMVCTGAKSEEQAIKAVRSVVQKLRKGGIPVENDPIIEIQNIVASASLGGKIHLELAARILPRSMYEPEQFPGLIHRMLDPKTVILLFASGKLVCTGAKKETEVYRAVTNLHTLLEEKNLMIYES